MTVGYLGPTGSYSQIAAETFRPSAKLQEYTTFPELFSALVDGRCDYIAVPIENSLNGGVLQNIDLLQKHGGIIACEEHTVKIDHRLATLDGADLKNIKRIYSHPQALAQCGEYLARNFPHAELIASTSTAASLSMIKDCTEAGIVGAHTHAEGVKLSDENIADEAVNLTHFLLVRRGNESDVEHSEKVFFSATCRHKPGELLDLLSLIRGLNMTKIESRPIKEKPGEYRFFIEIEADISSNETISLLDKVKQTAHSFKLLGAY